MSVNKTDVEFYIERQYSDFLERMTDDEIDDVVLWCNRVIRTREKIENDIKTNIEIAISELKDRFDDLYNGNIDISFITEFDMDDITDADGNFDYTVDEAVKKLRPDFPFFENLDSFDRENLIETLVDALNDFSQY